MMIAPEYDGRAGDVQAQEVEMLSRLISVAVMTPGRLSDPQIDEALVAAPFADAQQPLSGSLSA